MTQPWRSKIVAGSVRWPNSGLTKNFARLISAAADSPATWGRVFLTRSANRAASHSVRSNHAQLSTHNLKITLNAQGLTRIGDCHSDSEYHPVQLLWRYFNPWWKIGTRRAIHPLNAIFPRCGKLLPACTLQPYVQEGGEYLKNLPKFFQYPFSEFCSKFVTKY